MGLLSQTFLDSTSGECAQCHLKPPPLSILKCEICKKSYHANCDTLEKVNQPCAPSFLSNYHTPSTKKPNFSWKCDICAIDQDIADKVALSHRVDNITRTIETLTEAIEKISDKISTPPSANPMPPGVISNTTGNPWSNAGAVQQLRSSFIIKKHATNGKADIKKIEQIVEDGNFPVYGIGQTATGDTIINCPAGTTTRSLLEQKINEDNTLKEHDIHPLQEFLPSISIVGVTTNEWANTPCSTQTEQTQRKEDFKQRLLDKNHFLDTLVTSGETFNILFMKPPGNGYNNYQIVARVTPAIRDAIHRNSNKLFIKATSVRVYDRFYVKRCFKCNGFGHYTAGCNGDISCGICCTEGAHESKDCPDRNKQGTSHHKCINCKKDGKPYTDHNASSAKCPAYIIAQKKLRSNIPYYIGKNWPTISRQ